MASYLGSQFMPVLNNLVEDWFVRPLSDHTEQLARHCREARQMAARLEAASDAAQLYLKWCEEQLDAHKAYDKIERFAEIINGSPKMEYYSNPDMVEIESGVKGAVEEIKKLDEFADYNVPVIIKETENLRKDFVFLEKACKEHPEILSVPGLRESVKTHARQVITTIRQTRNLNFVYENIKKLKSSADENASRYALVSTDTLNIAPRSLKVFWIEASQFLLQMVLITCQFRTMLSRILLMKANGRYIAEVQKCALSPQHGD